MFCKYGCGSGFNSRVEREEHEGLCDKTKKGETMEELQKALITEIGKQLESNSKNIQLLDVLNRLLGTVSSYLLAKKG